MKENLTKPCKKLYHTFKFKGRTITLCVKKQDNVIYPVFVGIGMSICNPEDVYDEKMGRKIAYDRADHPKRQLTCYLTNIQTNCHTYGTFKSLLEQQVERIKLNPKQYIPSLK